MEPLTIATVVVSALTIASKISSDLIPFLNSVSRAPREVTLVETEVRCLSGTLQNLQAHFNTQSGTYTEAQLEQLLRVVTETQGSLTSLPELAGKFSRPGVFGRARWTMNLAEVDLYRVALSACTSMLNLLVVTLSE